ncbi:hypothetical protein LP316_01130 [Thalassotalea sp. LPB0316]|uniref:hypothetical protein n=1 Tax=Thalassotalea sp. LPB0316 TaxID=2769490 RepID=UPI0018666E9B|nr:hypothetical protein [Thalassotalea sp. LPB0316]QOL25949.1 hypothetical protein LP316_01130 [Thalassotalea sp. LPB0316]
MVKSIDQALNFIAKKKLSVIKVELENMPIFYKVDTINYEEYDFFAYSFEDSRIFGACRYVAIPRNSNDQIIDLGFLGE